MIDHTTAPQFRLLVYGDWSTVIRTFDGTRLRDDLLNQKPHDEDDADYGQYSLPFANMTELKSWLSLCDAARLHCELSVRVKSDETGVQVDAETGDGWGSQGKPHATVRLNAAKVNADLTAAVHQAVAILEKAGRC